MTGATTRPMSRSAASTTVTAFALGGGGGGRLEPDEAAADDKHPLRRRQPLPQLERVNDIAQVADPGQVGPGHRQPPRPGPGGQRQAAELEAAAALR